MNFGNVGANEEQVVYNEEMSENCMMELEISMFPHFKTPENIMDYLYIRNTIVKMWQNEPHKEVTVDQIHRNLRHRELECKDICKVFEFLVRYGYINVGLYKFSKEPLLKTGKKVIIIGAGLSGICAARQLLKMGIDVIILEASDRVGGRIQTISYPRLDYGRDFADIGASVIRCSKNNPMSTLLQQLNCTRSAIPEEFPVYDQVGKQLIAHRTAVMKDMFNHLIQLVAHVNSNGPILDGEGRELDLERSLLYMTQVLNIDKRETRKSLQSMRNKLSEIMVLHKELSLNKRIHRPSFGSEINTESIQIGGVTHIEKEAAMLVQGFVSKVHKMSSDQIKSDRVKKDGYSHRLVREKVYEDMKMMDFNKAVYEGQHGAPLSFLSSKHCKVREDTKHIRNRMQITEGLGYLIRTLATPIKNKIILGCRVAEIDYTDKDLVRVKCLRGESKETFHLSESHVLVTVPLGVLKDTAENKEDCIKFNPPLPDVKIAAIKEMGWGHVNKIAMWFESLFWKPKNLCFGYLNENPANRGKMFYFTTSPGSHTLTAEMSGLSAIYNRTDEEIVKECVCVLKKIFGEHKVPMPKRYVVSRWHEQPNIKGAMSFLHPGSNPEICDVISCNLMCAVSTDGSSCKPKVFFAGEHTCRNHIGTLEGAWHSGVREAAKIAAAILGSPFDSSENCRGTLNQYEDVFAFKQSHTFMKKFESLAERLDKAYSEAEQARKYDPTPACHGSDAVKSSSSSAVNKTSGSNMKFASTIGIKRNVGVKKQTPPKVGLLNPQSRGPYLTIPKPEILYQPSSLVQGKVCTFLSTVGSEGTTHHKPMQSGAKHQIAFSQRPSCIRDIVQPAVLMSNLIPTLAKEAETKIVVVEERSRAFKVPKVELAPSIASRNKLVAKKNNRSVSSSHENSTIEFSPAKAKCKKRIDHDYIKKKESKTSFSSSISGSDLKRTHSDTAQTSSKTLIVKIKRFKPTDSSDTSQPFATLVSSVSKDDLRPTEIISAINVPLSPAQPMSTPVLPVSIAAQPMSISFQSVSIPVQPVFTSVQPVSNPVQPGSISVQPMSIPFQPMPFLAQPVSIPVQPVSTSVEPVSNPVQPGSISVQPMSIPFQPMPFVAQPVSIPEQPMSFLAQPVPISFQSVSIPVQPVSTSVQPVSNLVQPGSISVQPMSIPFQPMPFLVQPVSIPPHSTQYPQISEELWNFMRKFALERMAKYLYMERAFLDAAYIITYTVTHAKSVAFPDDHSSTGIPFLLVTLIGGEYMCRAVNLASEVFNEKLDSVIESVMRTEPNDFVQAHAISTKLNEEYMTRIQELASSLTDEYISRAQIVASQVIARSMEDEIIDVVGLDETDNPAFELVTPDVSIVQDLTSTQTLKNGELGNKETTQRDTVDLNDSKEDGIKVEKKKVNTALSDEDLYLDWSGSQIMKPRKCARESAAKIKKIQCAHKKERAPRKVKVDKKPRQAKKTLEKRSKTEKNPPVFRVKRKYVRKTIKNISNQRISELEGISDNLMADNQIENHDDEQPCVVTDADNKDENDELIPSDYTGDAFHHGSAVFNGDIHDHIEEYDRQVLEPNGCQPIFFAPIIAPERLNETISNDENMLVDVSNYEEVITTLPEPVFYDRFGNAFVNDENYVYTNPEDVIEIFEEDLELFDRPLDLAELWEEHLGEDQETMRNLNRPAGMDPFHQRDSIFEDVNDLIEEDEETVLQMIRSARRTDPLVEDDQF